MRAKIWDITEPETSSGPNNQTGAAEWAILLRIILAALAFKLLIALILPLGLDEAYAIAVAREYSLSFFDHPPLSFWAPVFAADLTGLEHRLIFRLPFLLAGVVTTALMYLVGKELAGRRAGLWTALLYAVAPFFLISGGFMAVPDGLLNLGLAAAVLALMKIVRAEGKAPFAYWVWVGLAMAFALASKYQAAWLPIAVLLFMIATPKGRTWFAQPGPWLAGVLGLLGLLPVVLWNIENNWASFAFHTSRAGGGLSPGNLIWMIVAQSLFLLPTGMIAAIAGLRLAMKHRADAAWVLLALVALGPILMFNYIYFTSQTSLAHWSMPGWMFALPLAGGWLASGTRKAARRHLRWSTGFFVVIWLPLLTLVVHSNTGFLTRSFYDQPPKWDQTLETFDFGDLQSALKQRDLWDRTEVFMATTWAYAGIFDTALAAQKPMRVFHTDNAHHFAYLSDAKATGQALYLAATQLKDAAATEAQVLANARILDATAELLPPIILTRGGQPYIQITLVGLNVK